MECASLVECSAEIKKWIIIMVKCSHMFECFPVSRTMCTNVLKYFVSLFGNFLVCDADRCIV